MRRLACLALIVLGLLYPGVGVAQYKFISGNPSAAITRLVDDMQQGAVQFDWFTADGQRYYMTIKNLAPNTSRDVWISALGAVVKACPAAESSPPGGDQLRYPHDPGQWLCRLGHQCHEEPGEDRQRGLRHQRH